VDNKFVIIFDDQTNDTIYASVKDFEENHGFTTLSRRECVTDWTIASGYSAISVNSLSRCIKGSIGEFGKESVPRIAWEAIGRRKELPAD
jgi:hypothetical protein